WYESAWAAGLKSAETRAMAGVADSPPRTAARMDAAAWSCRQSGGD
ncbi:MAG: hypothetical protein AVDCRST_MAG51-3085, partial [uncultured Ramlibacter sp.]